MSKTTCWNVFGEAIATSNIIFGLSWNVWSCSGCGKFSLKHILTHRSCSRLRVWAESSKVAVTCIWHHVLMPQLYKIHWFQETTSTAIFSLFHVHILRVGTIILITWGTKCIPFIIFKKGEKITKTEYNHCLKDVTAYWYLFTNVSLDFDCYYRLCIYFISILVYLLNSKQVFTDPKRKNRNTHNP